jgi:branched-chain amino acid aminotransferase
MTSIALKPTSNPLSDADRQSAMTDPGFGRVFTDNMVTIPWTEGQGWHDAQLVPYAPTTIDPASMVLHYGQTIFEGLKAYRLPDSDVACFRPFENAHRFQRSARRLAMPELPDELFIGSIDALVRQEAAWVPDSHEESLYLRPFMIPTEVGLGVRPSNAYLYTLIASPAGAYFAGGVKPVTVWLSTDYTRAAPGGTGAAKCGGNYAASLAAQAEAAAKGCDQVVWLDANEHRHVEEMGGMNLCFVYGSGEGARIVTPALNGALLPGVTRDSLLTLARDLGYESSEGDVTIDQWREGNASGEISEVFACGTAAVITPVGAVKSADHDWTIGDGGSGPITMRLRDALLSIQHGTAPDQHGWLHRVP